MSILARGSLSKLVMYLYRRVDGVLPTPAPEMALLQR